LILLLVTDITVNIISPDYPVEEPIVQHPLLYIFMIQFYPLTSSLPLCL